MNADGDENDAEDAEPHSAEELHKAALKLMEEKHKDMEFLKEHVR